MEHLWNGPDQVGGLRRHHQLDLLLLRLHHRRRARRPRAQHDDRGRREPRRHHHRRRAHHGRSGDLTWRPIRSSSSRTSRCRFGRVEVLRGVSFQVERNETLCILGGSGGGKSTLLKVMIGNLRPTQRARHPRRRRHRRMDEKRLNARAPQVRRHVPARRAPQLDDPRRERRAARSSSTRSSATTSSTRWSRSSSTRWGSARRPTSGPPRSREACSSAPRSPARSRATRRSSSTTSLRPGLDPISTTRIDVLINELKNVMKITNVVVTHVMESVRRIADHVVMLDAGARDPRRDLKDLQESQDPAGQGVRFGRSRAESEEDTARHARVLQRPADVGRDRHG